jgi:uncharacterized protein (DUF2236 family)
VILVDSFTWQVSAVIITALIGVIVAIMKLVNPSKEPQSVSTEDIIKMGHAIGEGIGRAVARASGEVCPAHSGMTEAIATIKISIDTFHQDVRSVQEDIKEITRILIDMQKSRGNN